MTNSTEKYLEIMEEFNELTEMLEGMLGKWSMLIFKTKLSKIEYDICNLYMADDMRAVSESTNIRIRALEDELDFVNARIKRIIKCDEKIRNTHCMLLRRLEEDGLRDKYWTSYKSEK